MLPIVAATLACVGCSAQLGPQPEGWVAWDVCGWDGGVVFELEVMQQRLALGCAPGPDRPAAPATAEVCE